MDIFSFTAAFFLATEEIDPATVKPGWLGGAFVIAMAIAVAVLLWSFAKNVKRARQPWSSEGDSSTPQQ